MKINAAFVALFLVEMVKYFELLKLLDGALSATSFFLFSSFSILSLFGFHLICCIATTFSYSNETKENLFSEWKACFSLFRGRKTSICRIL